MILSKVEARTAAHAKDLNLTCESFLDPPRALGFEVIRSVLFQEPDGSLNWACIITSSVQLTAVFSSTARVKEGGRLCSKQAAEQLRHR
jgi:hypothetical protein